MKTTKMMRAVLPMLLLAAPLLAADVAVSAGEVVPGEWNADLSAVLKVANQTHRPLLLVHTSQGCPLCARLNQAINGEAFYRWQKDRNLLMAYVRTRGLSSPRYRQTRGFIKDVAGALPGSPSICVCWFREDGTTNGVAFAGRRGEMMPDDKSGLFSVELMSAVDHALKDYLAQGPAHASVAQIVSNSTKTIAFKVAGSPGSVTMRPSTGILPEGGKVILEAHPAADGLFASWIGPDGNVDSWNYRLEVAGRMPAGSYTARFRPKADCPPPAVAVASTSVCARVGNRFEHRVAVDESCRPVHFRSAQRMPKWLKLDKYSGLLWGTPKQEGSVKVSVAVIGSDAVHTTKICTIMVTILPALKEK